jgi:hypothetical protein
MFQVTQTNELQPVHNYLLSYLEGKDAEEAAKRFLESGFDFKKMLEIKKVKESQILTALLKDLEKEEDASRIKNLVNQMFATTVTLPAGRRTITPAAQTVTVVTKEIVSEKV